jgi:hypothetical protein
LENNFEIRKNVVQYMVENVGVGTGAEPYIFDKL